MRGGFMDFLYGTLIKITLWVGWSLGRISKSTVVLFSHIIIKMVKFTQIATQKEKIVLFLTNNALGVINWILKISIKFVSYAQIKHNTVKTRDVKYS